MILGLIASAIPIVGKLLDKVIPDPEMREKAKYEMAQMIQSGDIAELRAVADVIATEAKSSHWIVAAWRPITMLTFVAIIANNYILAPYLGAMFGWSVMLEIPPDLWGLIKIGLGGYVAGRSIEKATANWKGNS